MPIHAMQRTLLCLIVTVLIARTLTSASFLPSDSWNICSNDGTAVTSAASTASLFTPLHVDVVRSNVSSHDLYTVTLIGSLATAVTDGTYELTTVLEEQQGATNPAVSSTSFGVLSHYLISMPAVSPNSSQIALWYKPNFTSDANSEYEEVSMNFAAYTQDLKSLVCIELRNITQASIAPATPAAGDDKKKDSKLLGYMCALVSVVFFGTNFLPVKAYDTGDGVFFQWMMCIGIWMCGLLIQLIRQSSFEPFAMLGGVMWAIGNMTTVPIIRMIGLGVGMCLWGTAGLVMGWSCGKFGILGTKSQAISSPAMNWIGLILCISSMSIMFQVKTVKAEEEAAREKAGRTHAMSQGDEEDSVRLTNKSSYDLLQPISDTIANGGGADATHEDEATSSEPSVFDKLSPNMKRVLGISLALMAGLLYGCNFNPPQYLIDSGRGSSSHGIDYVFSHFTGILCTSTLYMIAYTVYMKNKPTVLPQIVLPGLASGIGWAIAQINWFIANDNIHFIGTFPLVSCGPGILATLCAIVFYKEIQGKKNYAMLGLAAIVTFVGVILIAFSLPAGS